MIPLDKSQNILTPHLVHIYLYLFMYVFMYIDPCREILNAYSTRTIFNIYSILGVHLLFKLGFAGGVHEQGGKELAIHPLVQIELCGLWG